MEAIENLLVVLTTVEPIGEMISELTGWNRRYEPIYWTLLYLSAIWIFSCGGRVAWNFFRGMGILYLIIMVIYMLGSFSAVNYPEYVVRDPTDHVTEFHGVKFLEALPSAAWFFLGIECLPLAGSVTKDVRISKLFCVVFGKSQ